MAVEVVVLSSGVGAGVSAIAEAPFDELGLLVLATLFDGAFVALPAVVACGGGELTALRVDASSLGGVATSAALGMALSPAAFVLAMFTGDEGVDAATFEAGGVVLAAVSEGVSWLSSTAPPTTTATIVPKAIGK